MPKTPWRQSRWLAVIELALVALVFYLDHLHKIPVSKTPFLLALGWLSLRLRGLRWRDVGLSRNRSWKITMALGIVFGVVTEAFQLFITQPVVAHFTGYQPDLSDFAVIHGNLKIAGLAVGLAWTLAAFGEEMVWRGYLMNRVADLGGRNRVAWVASLVLVNAAFGCAHSNQGLSGAVIEGLAGVWLGLLYLGTGYNLTVPIISHGLSDTIDVVLLYLGKYPGV